MKSSVTAYFLKVSFYEAPLSCQHCSVELVVGLVIKLLMAGLSF